MEKEEYARYLSDKATLETHGMEVLNLFQDKNGFLPKKAEEIGSKNLQILNVLPKNYETFSIEYNNNIKKIKEKETPKKAKVLRQQLLAEQFLKNNSDVFIKKINGNIHFCKIIRIGKTKLCIDNYAPSQRTGTRDYIDWLNIETIEEVKGNDLGD